MPAIHLEQCMRCYSCVTACCMGVLSRSAEGPVVDTSRSCTLCTHCAAACPEGGITFDAFDTALLYAPPPEDPVARAVTMRRSIRHFRTEVPPPEMLRKSLDLAEYAPSGRNLHTRQWRVLLGREAVERAALLLLESVRRRGVHPQLAKRSRDEIKQLVLGAPCLLLCCDRPDNINAPEDAVAAATTAELLLSHSGLGVCWSGYITHNAKADPEYCRALGVPEELTVYSALLTGWPDREVYVRPAYRPPAKVSWS